jgi:LacI family transcriptional regulator
MPRDISLIGFDDYTWMSARATPLTAIFQPVREMGRALWDTLSARIKGELSPAKHILFPCELRVRKSTGPVPDARPARQATAAPAGTDARQRIMTNSGSPSDPDEPDQSIRNLPERQTMGGQ